MTVKRHSYRWFALLALIVLLMPLIAACGGDGATATQPATTNTQAPAANTQQPSGNATTPDAQPTAAPTGGTTGQVGGECTTKKGGTLVVGIVQEPDILDPYVTGMTFSVWILNALNTPMIRAVQGGKLQPVLLKEVPTPENGGISKDGKTYTVNFREGLKWSDGQPLTAKDLHFTWKTVMNPEYGSGTQEGWNQIKDVKLSNNDLTATITLKNAYVPFLAYVLASNAGNQAGFLLPEHKFQGKKPAEYAKSDYGLVGSAGHVGSGPFKIESWKKGEAITLTRNENYVGKQSCLDKVVYSVLENADLQTTQLGEGEIQVATNYTAGDLPTLDQLSQSAGVQVFATPAVGSIERYIFNLKDPKDPNTRLNPAKAKPHPIFGDKNVRMAVIMGMNRPAVAEKLLSGKAQVGVTELDGSQWFNKNLSPYPYDPEKAKQLLDQAGWKPGGDGIREKNGQKLSFTHITTSGNTLRENVQRAFISDLKAIGVDMRIGNQKSDKLFASYSQGGTAATGAFDVVGYTTGITPLDPDLTPFYASDKIPSKANGGIGSNNGRYISPDVDKLLEQQVVELDPAKRQELLNQIQQKVYDDAPVVYVYDRLTIDAATANVKGIVSDPVAGFWWNLEDWYLEE